MEQQDEPEKSCNSGGHDHSRGADQGYVNLGSALPG
jgi:hypothetical protein